MQANHSGGNSNRDWRVAGATGISTVGHGLQQAADVVAIKEGADLDLGCPIVVPSEDVIISWTCDNEPANIRSSRIHVTEAGKLRIRSAKIGDSCNYRCEAADGFGTLSVIIKVIIVDKKLVDQLSRQNHTSTSHHHPHHRQQKASTTDASWQHSASVATTDLPNSGNYSTSAIDAAANVTSSSQQQQQETLDVHIEPSFVKISKNRTFSLECRVKHFRQQQQQQQHQQPQIIWLKEFIGHKPDSLSEAYEKNLVSIDNVYYHSLNWPRSITQSNKSSTTNSALLVRQSNLVHSGKYICFAGYPPYTMSSSLSSEGSNNNGNSNGAGRLPRYNMASAEVQVVQEGEENHLSHWSSKTTTTSGTSLERRQRYLLVSVVSNNTWPRNLTIILIIFCGLLCLMKICYVKYRTGVETNSKNGGGTHQRRPIIKQARQPQQVNVVGSQQTSLDTNGNSQAMLSQLVNTTRAQQRSNPSGFQPLRSVKSTSVQVPSAKQPTQFAGPNSIHLLKQFQPLAKIPGDLSDCDMIDDDSQDEHLYSEIGDRLAVTNNIGDQEYYKVPVMRDKRLS